MYISDKDFLAHYGVLGMKWGVRRGSKSSGLLARKKSESRREKRRAAKRLEKEQKAYDENVKKNWHHAYNKAANYANETLIPQINKKYGKYDWTKLDTTNMDDPKGDPKLVEAYKKYINEYEKSFNKVLNEEYDKIFGKRPGS